MEESPIKAVENRQPDGTFGPGNNANPKGRPPGKSLKEYDREKFAKMTDEEKEEFLSKIAPDMRYRMAEGNPHQTSDVTSAGKPIPILGNALSNNDSDKENTGTDKEN